MARHKARATSSPDDLAPGELVPLADGPVASVLAGVDKVTGEAFALKVYPGALESSAWRELDAEQARLLALRSAAPLLVADRVQQHDGNCAVRMELCAQSLPELIGSCGPLSVPDALALVETVATALAVAHQAGVVHGGVTPGNVLFRPSGEAVLADFGLTLRSAFPYGGGRDVSCLPPETVRDGVTGEKADIYGIGAILYLALSARPPQGGQHPDGLVRVLDFTPGPLNRTDLPRGLPELLSSLLAREPAARPSAADVVARLGTIDAGAAAATGVASAHVVASSPTVGAEFDDFARPDSALRPIPDGAGDGIAAAFNDFGPTPDAAPGQPVAVATASPPRRKVTPGMIGLGAAAALCAGGMAALVMLLSAPDEPVVKPDPADAEPASRSPEPEPVDLRLRKPVDRGDFVQLSWQSSSPLDYAVIVAAEDEPATAIRANRRTLLRVAVDPRRRYCFAVQGTDGNGLYESMPQPIRGATCDR